MARKAKELGPLAVSNLKQPGLHAVGGVAGLYLQILPPRTGPDGQETLARTWVLRVMIGGKRRDMGLGSFGMVGDRSPAVSLAAAREAARKAREKIQSGIDPIEERKALRSALRAESAKVMTFEEAAKAYVAAHEKSWRNDKHRQQWVNTLKTYAHPHLGKLSVADIELAHVLAVLEPIWAGKTATATRLRGRIETILDWAIARGLRQGLNPARWRGHLDKMLAAPSKIAKVEHHSALRFADVPAFMVRLRAAEGMGARALEFAILTATRSGETRGAKWSEIDLAEKVWIIPADRMKAGREHRVPLSAPAVALLHALPRIDGSDLVFPSPKGGQMSDMTLLAVMRRMDLDAVPHGFRSTFRDWAAERTNYPRDVAEMALAHTIGDKVEAAYRRGDLFAKRARMMADWARAVSAPPMAENVTNIRQMAK